MIKDVADKAADVVRLHNINNDQLIVEWVLVIG